MFIKFFQTLREKGLHVTLGEWLTMQEALDQGLCGSSLTQFSKNLHKRALFR